MTEIILVKYKAPQFETRCIKSILDNTFCPYSLRVYDNEPQNKNLGKLWNQLIRQSDSEYVCLLNTDTIVTPYWLERLIEVLEKEEKVGIVGPSSNYSGGLQDDVGMGQHWDYDVVDYSVVADKGTLSGFCMVFPKYVWEEVGEFPNNAPFYGQEDIFIDRIREHGYKQLWRRDVWVWHYGKGSAKLAEARKEMNIDKEMQKGRDYRDRERQKK